jgi:cyclic pyranopterin phosphate synthase
MKDMHGREINYARISVTDRCNLRCRYCMPDCGIVQKHHSEILSLEDLEEISKCMVSLGINKIRVTGGEPLVRKGVVAFLARLKQIDGLNTLALTTNGVLLNEYAIPLKAAGVESLNISLDSLDPKKFLELARFGELNNVLSGIEAARMAGFEKIKLNTVLLKGINDDEILSLINYGAERNFDVRFIELMPFEAQNEFANSHYISADEIIAKLGPVEYLGPRNNSVAVYYKTESGASVGFIRPMQVLFVTVAAV